MLAYNEIKQKKLIALAGEPYEVLSSHVFRKQQRKPVNQTKLRHLATGKVIERSFHQQESVSEADIEKKSALYLYRNRKEAWFSEVNDRSKRFSLNETLLGDGLQFIKENTPVDVLMFDGKVIRIALPVKIDLEVVDAPPSIKGNTAQGGAKQAKLETGAVVLVPLFINVGDTVRVNTETGEYVERVEKH